MRLHPILAPCVVLALAVLVPASARSQDPAAAPPAQPVQTELVFEREVFEYPQFARRNPFMPLVAANRGGPPPEQLRLVGVIYSEDPAASVAILGTSGLSVSEDGTSLNVSEGQAWYVRRGQTVGNVTVVEIQVDHVVIEIDEFGLTNRRTLTIQTRRLGGTP